MSMMAKIILFHVSGNVGKSTIAKGVLIPRIPDAEVISVETINDGLTPDEAERLSAQQCEAVFNRVGAGEDVVVDVGSSNAEAFVKAMGNKKGAYKLFDLWIVPVVTERKQFNDTCATLEMLAGIGVKPENILVVMNRMNGNVEDVRDEYAALFDYHAKNPVFMLNENAAIPQTEAYDLARGVDKSFGELAVLDTDKAVAAMRKAPTREERSIMMNVISAAMTVQSQNDHHDRVWGVIETTLDKILS